MYKNNIKNYNNIKNSFILKSVFLFLYNTLSFTIVVKVGLVKFWYSFLLN